MPKAHVDEDLVFTTSPKPGSDRERVTFNLDGAELTAQRPKQAHLLLLSEASSRHVSIGDKVYMVFQFLDGVLDTESARHVRDRLLDPADPLDAADVFAIMERLVARWTDDPDPLNNRASRRAVKKTTVRR